ncbi:MAG TPA: rhodanese-like domain-containing protein [Desulfuromonadaceae bacterium]|jgi:rhodanese-related sulfurtransferase
MFKRIIVAGMLTLCAGSVFAAQYIKPDELRNKLEQKKPVIIIDIQTPADFAVHHLESSLETNAYPVKSDEERKKLDTTLPAIKSSNSPVVIVCPRGKGGAVNSYEYLKSQGVPEERLFILEGGMAGWPYKDLLKQGR